MKVLVCPLDWGLGHATRCVPLIRALLAAGHQVRVGAGGGGLDLLRAEFPGMDVFRFPGYRVRYGRSAASFLPVMLAQLPALLWGLRAERGRLARILAEHPCDLVISDGRYGLRPSGIPSILITHQIGLKVPGRFPGRGLAERLLRALNFAALRKFDRVWIPDHAGDLSLSGELGEVAGMPANVEWIGPLCRFSEGATTELPRVDVLAVVSGPEPQRSLFETALRGELGKLGGMRVLVRGLPGAGKGKAPSPIPKKLPTEGYLEFDHLPGTDLAGLLMGAGLVVARSGYTTVMELAGLGAAAAVLIPTPGQSEQEYLAEHLHGLGAAVKREQHRLDLAAAGREAKSLPGFRRWRGAALSGNLEAFLAEHPLLRQRQDATRLRKAGQQL